MNARKGGATDTHVMLKWPDSPTSWGFDDWNDIGPYALDHALALTLHDRPFFNQQQKHAGAPPQALKAGMVLAVEFYTGKKGAKDSVHLEQNILVTKGGYERLSLWVAEELMECWLPYE